MSVRSTIGEVLAGHAARDPGAIAIVCPGLEAMTFGDLERNIRRIGDRLRAAGIGSASRVGIALPRGPEAALLSIAVCCTATLLPLNPNLPPADLEIELQKLRLDGLIVAAGEPLPAWVDGATARPGAGLFAVSKAVSSFADIDLEQLRPVPRTLPASPLTPHSWAAIFRTSGTTGTSKRVPVTHENLIEMANKMERWLELTPRDRSTCIMPIYYNAGFKATLLVPLLIGCSVALPASTNPADFDRWLAELQPTWLTAAPAFLQAVVEKLQPYPHRPPSSSLRFVLSTASYLAEAARGRFEEILKVPVGEFYGLCEAGMMTRPVLFSEPRRADTAGLAPEGELAIQDEVGNLQPPGQAGQVVLRGPSVMPGYLFDDIEGTPSGLKTGWLATGDLGVLDDKGFLRILGRTKEIINRGGEKISPYDVEKALLRHPAVREAAAFPVPHPRLGENVGVAAVLHAGAEATSAELLEFVYQHLAPFQMPRHIHIVDVLPVGPTGKISRPKLSVAFRDHREPTERPAASLEILIADIWQRILRRDDIGLDDDFVEIGGDSLQAAEMMIELEEITHQRIDPSDIRATFTIRTLCDALARQVSRKHELVTRVRSGTGVPLFLCHGDFCGWGMYGFRLGDLLAGDSPVYLLHSMLDVVDGVETMEQTAARYLPDIAKIAPDGPVLLAGYCHGGLTALELTRRLESAGRTVDTLLLIDTFSINARPVMRAIAPSVLFASRFVPGELGRRLRRNGMPSLWRVVSHLLAGDRSIAQRVGRSFKDGKTQVWDSSRRTLYYRAMSKFVPSKVRAKLICLLSDECRPKKDYATEAWTNIAGDVTTHSIRGNHSTCISRHVEDLAACINRTMFAGDSVVSPPAPPPIGIYERTENA